MTRMVLNDHRKLCVDLWCFAASVVLNPPHSMRVAHVASSRVTDFEPRMEDPLLSAAIEHERPVDARNRIVLVRDKVRHSTPA